MDKIKVLVVDDSALMRRIISDMINAEEDLEVIATARNGSDLLEKLNHYSPQVITLDIEMPNMDGISVLREFKRLNINIPVIMLSSLSPIGARQTVEALEAGAFDFIQKPSGGISLDIDKVKEELVEKIRAGFQCSLRSNSKSEEKKITRASYKPFTKNVDAIVIGASTGGPKALYSLVTAFPKWLGLPVFIVQHMPVGFTKAFAERLNLNSNISVKEAEDGEAFLKDMVYVAPGGKHMVLSDNSIVLTTEPPIWGVRPAVDKLFMSAVKTFDSRLISVVLTGMGKDGAQGTVKVKEQGGITISQDKATSTIYGMPKAAYETGKVDLVLPLNEIVPNIMNIIGRRDG